MSYLKHHWHMALILAVIALLWATPVTYPLRLLVIFFHEAAHALAALLTGGRVIELAVNPDEGGHAITQGGNFFAIVSAGYLGSLLIGAGLLTVALRSRLDRLVLGALGALLLLLCLFYVRELFALAIGIGTGIGFVAMARWLPEPVCDLVLRVIGLFSMAYVPLDIFSDTLARPGALSDARILAEHFGGPSMLWGLIWLGLSLWLIFITLRRALRVPSNIALQGLDIRRPPRD